MYGKPPSPANDEDGKVGGPDISQTFDALGRAWSSDLLSKNVEGARGLLDAGRAVAAQYWRVYGFGTADSLARFQPSGSHGVPNPARDKIREDALNEALDTINKLGRGVRNAFDQLVIDPNPDCGPKWLDRIIAASRVGDEPSRGDVSALNMALIGLRAVA